MYHVQKKQKETEFDETLKYNEKKLQKTFK